MSGFHITMYYYLLSTSTQTQWTPNQTDFFPYSCSTSNHIRGTLPFFSCLILKPNLLSLPWFLSSLGPYSIGHQIEFCHQQPMIWSIMTLWWSLNKPPPKSIVWSASGLVTRWRYRESGTPRGSMEALLPFPHTHPMYLFFQPSIPIL